MFVTFIEMINAPSFNLSLCETSGAEGSFSNFLLDDIEKK